MNKEELEDLTPVDLALALPWLTLAILTCTATVKGTNLARLVQDILVEYVEVVLND